MNAIKFVGGMSLCAVLTGCVAGSDADVTSQDPTYTETAVRLNADGTQTVTTRTITLSEELRENAARDRLANQAGVPAVGTERIGTASEEVVTQNTSCPGSSFWLYDQVNNLGNKMCFSGTGNVDLSQAYCPSGSIYCLIPNDNKKSYYSGVDSGFFQSQMAQCVAPTLNHCTAFATNHSSSTLTSCEAAVGSHFLNLGQVCLAPTVSMDGQSPMHSTGSQFTHSGSVKVQVFKNGSSIWSDTFVTADASGNAAFVAYNNSCAGVCPSCDETLKYTDMTSGLSATTPITGTCF